TLDPRDEAAGAPLNRISAGLVIRFLGSEVQRNVLRREPGKMHQRGFHKLQPPPSGRRIRGSPVFTGLVRPESCSGMVRPSLVERGFPRTLPSRTTTVSA